MTGTFSSGDKYFLERSEVDEVFHEIDSGRRVIVVCSDLGNGKSVFLDGLRMRALERGYRVFEAREHNQEAASEIEMIANLPGRILLTIEEYHHWLDEIRLFRLNASDRAVLVLTARNFIHDVVLDDLLENVGLDEIPEIRLDLLDNSECQWWVAALDEYGLWGEYAGYSQERKMRFIKHTCGGQIHAVLLRLLDSPQIGGKLKTLSEQLILQNDKYRVLLSLFILTIMNQMPTMDNLVDFWGAEILGSASFRKDPVIGQFVDVERGKVIVRSPIAAQFVLRRIADANLIVAVMTHLAKRASAGARVSDEYRHLLNNLCRFSSLQLILPENQPGAVVKFYESAKNLEGCKGNPLFWLQYAIACLVIQDLFRAEKYFRTAYSIAEDRGWDTFQIDNHFARFLLVQGIDSLEAKAAMANFRSARTIISRQMKAERLHYPYRVAILYQQFLERFGSSLSAPELDEIEKAAEAVSLRILQLPDERRKDRYVRKCQQAMQETIARAKELAAHKS